MFLGGKKVQLCVCLIFVSAILLVGATIVFFKYFAETKESKLLVPIVINTWNFSNANEKAWKVISTGGPALDALEFGINACELEPDKCRYSVGFGGNPDESGETTLDSLIMDGTHMNTGAVGGLREIKKAISVARYVLDNTYHSFIVGSRASEFAVSMGFTREPLTSNVSQSQHQKWRDSKCQPNFWKDVTPDPKSTCGPYKPLAQKSSTHKSESKLLKFSSRSNQLTPSNHDTIGMISIDHQGNVAAGTSTNGLRHKIPGRVGDSPIAGAGAFAETGIGAAVATGDGDIMMRFAPTVIAVELLRNGYSAHSAARESIDRIAKYYPHFEGALIVASPYGDYAAACNGYETFPFFVHKRGGSLALETVKCS